MQARIATIILVLLLSIEAVGTTITAASCSQANVTTAVTSAVSGDIVQVPSGTCAWSALTVPNTKGITLLGGFGGTTTITGAGALFVNSNASTVSRVTGFTFNGAGGSTDGDLHIIGTSSSAEYRVDNNIFTNAGQIIFVVVDGSGAGLIDHNTFTGAGGSEMVHNVALGPASTAGWTDDVTPGSRSMVFVEDNTFTCNDPTFICSGVQSYYGARTVVRHNTFNFTQIDQHGTPGAIGARWFEFYENTFFPLGKNQSNYFDIRGGSGVIFNNHASGTNTGGGTLSIHEEDTGTWPLAYQPGSGINGQTNQHSTCSSGAKNSSPIYVWGNDSAIANDATQSPTLVQLNRDYLSSGTQPASLLRQQLSTDTCSTTYTYSSFTYPHPLQGTVVLPSPAIGMFSWLKILDYNNLYRSIQ